MNIDLDRLKDINIPIPSRQGYAIPDLPMKGDDGRRMFNIGPDGSYGYLGKAALVHLGQTSVREWIGQLHDTTMQVLTKGMVQGDDYPQSDFRVVHPDGRAFRVHVEEGETCGELVFRSIPRESPRLEMLRLKRAWKMLMLSPILNKGGLIVLAAMPGQGKSTTIAGIIRSRLTIFGGRCLTVEAPVELPLEGMFGNGSCKQREVRYDHPNPFMNGFSGGVYSALRSFPAADAAMVMIGEIRDKETAAAAIRAANAGFLVITTIHGDSIPTAVKRLVEMAQDEMGSIAPDMLASSLRMCVHQKLVIDDTKDGWNAGRIDGELMWSAGESSKLANAIKSGNYNSMEEILRVQRLRMEQADGQGTGQQELIKQLEGA